MKKILKLMKMLLYHGDFSEIPVKNGINPQ